MQERICGLCQESSAIYFSLWVLCFSVFSVCLLGRWDGKHALDLIYYKDLTSSDRILNSVAIIRQYVRQLIYFIVMPVTVK